MQNKTQVLDVDLEAFFDTVRHDLLLGKVARRVDDGDILHLLKLMLKASGKRGVPQGGVLSPLLSNVYLTEVDTMLERAKEATRNGRHTRVEYARYADDLVILVDGYHRHAWLRGAVERRLREELANLDLRLNEAKTRIVDLCQDESFGFLGFDVRRVRSLAGRLATAVHAEVEAAYGVAAEAQGGLPTLSFAASGAGDRRDQSDPARLGELLPGRARESVLHLRPGLGGEEGATPSDGGETSSRLRLEEVE